MADEQTIDDNTPDQAGPGDDKLSAIYSAVSKKYNLGTPDEFKAKMQDPAKRKAFYDGVGASYNLGTYDEFQTKIGTPSPTTLENWNAGINDANNTIKAAFNSKHTDKAIKKAAEDAFYQNLNKTSPSANPEDQQPINHSESQPIPRPNFVVPPDQLQQASDAFKEVVPPESDAGRAILEHSKDISKNADYVNNLNHAFYNKDRGNHVNPEIAGKIQRGELGYDFKQQRPTIQLNPAQAFIQGVEDHYNAVNKADVLASNSKEDIIKQEEEKRATPQNPDEPIPISKGWNIPFINISTSAITNTAGQTASGFAKAGIGTMASLIPGMEPAGASILGSMFIAHDAGKQVAGDTFESTYHELRNKGVNPSDAYDKAKSDAEFNGVTAAAQMAAMSYVGMKLGGKPLGGAVYNKGFKELLISQGKNTLQFIENAAPDVTAQSGLAALTQGVQNLHSGKPIETNMPEAVLGTAAFIGLISAAGALKSSLTPAERVTALNGFAHSDPSMVEAGINQAKVQKSLTPEEGDKLSADVKKQTELNNGLPVDVPEENKQKIQNRIAKKKALEEELANLDDAYKPAKKEKIKDINEEIVDLSKPTKPSPKESLPTEESNVPKTGTSEPTEYRAPEEVDQIMKQDLTKEQKNKTVKVKSFDPKTGEETVEEAPAKRAFVAMKRQHKILDQVLKCL